MRQGGEGEGEGGAVGGAGLGGEEPRRLPM